MMRLAGALKREYEDDDTYQLDIYTPANITSVNLRFKGEKVAKVLGKLAKARVGGDDEENAAASKRLSGVLVKKNFNHYIMAPEELPVYTELSTTELTQIVHVPFAGSNNELHYNLLLLTNDVKVLGKTDDSTTYLAFGAIEATYRSGVVSLKVSFATATDKYISSKYFKIFVSVDFESYE